MSEASGKDEGDDTADQPKRPSTLAEKAFAAVEDLETIVAWYCQELQIPVAWNLLDI